MSGMNKLMTIPWWLNPLWWLAFLSWGVFTLAQRDYRRIAASRDLNADSKRAP